MFPILNDVKLKNKFQIFTPCTQVELMLNSAEYTTNLFGKKFLENSCGNGEILIKAVERYISDCKQKRFSKKKIKEGLEKDFTAYEIDESRIKECVERLNMLVEKYKIHNVTWNIQCQDFLSINSETLYEYIVGNPPYIAYPDLPLNDRKFLKENFDSCKKGKFDYNYAFIEKSYSLLSNKGCLVYIIPSNIFKNVFAKSLRNVIKEDISLIIDYPNDVIFEGVLVSPAIIKVIKGDNSPLLSYQLTEKGAKVKIQKSNFKEKWVFEKLQAGNGIRIGDRFKVSSSVATLSNQVFVLRGGKVKEEYYRLNDCYSIEMSLLRKAASPKNKKYKKHKEYIIFPYYYDKEGNLNHFTEEEMFEKFPMGMKYLKDHEKKLDERDADNSAKWFEFGRSQALQNINQKIVLISSVISDCTEPYLLEREEVPYSGLYIASKGNESVDTVLPILKSEQFKDYVKKVGVNVSGTSKRISPKDIENYTY